MPDILALDWDRTGIRGVVARASREQIEEVVPLSLDSPAEIAAVESTADSARWLKDRLSALGVRPHKVIVILPRDEVVTRRLELPDVPDADLADVVRLQAAVKLATPVDRLVLDFLPLPKLEDHPGRAVLVMTIEKDWFTRVTSVVRQAGLDPAACYVSAAATAELAVRYALVQKQDADRPRLIVYQSGLRAELSLLHRRQLVFSQVVRLSDGPSEAHVQPLRAELARLLIALQQAYHGISIEDVLLLHEGDCDQQVLQVLEERFPERVRECVTADMLKELSLRSPDAAAVTAPGCGGALAFVHMSTPQINFVRPRQRPATKDPRQKRIALAAAAAVLIIGVAWFSYYRAVSERDAEIARLEDRKDELDNLLKRGEPISSSAADVGQWADRTPSARDMLGRFQAQLPGTDRVYLSNLRFSPELRDGVARITGTGYARLRSDKENLDQRLVENRYRVRPQTTSVSGRDPDFPVTFDIDAVLLPPEPPPRPAAAIANPAKEAAPQ